MKKIRLFALLMSVILLVSSTVIVNAETDLPYVDIDMSHWAALYAEQFYELGIDSGIEGGCFYPSHYALRGEACNFLYRFARTLGLAESSYVTSKGSVSFADLKNGEWYYEGMLWCIDNGLLYIPADSDKIEPLRAMTRAEMAYLIDNFLKKINVQLPDQQGDGVYTDTDMIPEWAAESVEEMRRTALIRADADSAFAPDGMLPRAGVLSIMYKMMPYTGNVKAIEKAEPLPTAIHREVGKDGYNATCTEDGLQAGMWCDVCTFVTKSQGIIPATGHKSDGYYYVDGYDPSSDFVTRYQYCVTCSETFGHEEYYPDFPYFDVSSEDWFFNSVKYVDFFGYMNGTSEHEFSPNTAMSRAMLITVLHRICGAPVVEGDSPFDDLQPDQTWYHDAVVWAYQNDIVTGTSSTTFSPTMSISREQLATILYRFAGKLGLDTSAETDLSVFPDSDKVSDWSKEALSWACAVGLITGADRGDAVYLDPTGTASRAQVATVLMRFLTMEIE